MIEKICSFVSIIRPKCVFLCCTIALLLFCSVSLSEAFKLPDTGQTKCYQGVSPFAEISCTGTGQDGAYNINPMSFTDNGNGTVTDNNTGLIWQKEDDNNTYNWYQAAGVYDATYNPSSQSVCGTLNLGGHSDWRLPSKKELMSIVDYSVPYPGPAINTAYFPNTEASHYFYWSATTRADDPNRALGWYFAFGDNILDNKSSNYYVRCVRGGQYPSQRFMDNGDGTVTDKSTGLIWQKGEPGSMSRQAALDYCNGLYLTNKTDWRLPNIKELESLIDDSRYNPAIDRNFFPNAYASSYLSSTIPAGIPNYDWCVYFSDGFVYTPDWTVFSYHSVRCVRGGQSGSLDNLPGTATAAPSSGSWANTPQNINVSTNGATTIYLRMVNTYDGTTPPDPPVPSPTSNDGWLSGSSGTFQYYGNGGQLKKTKLRFVGCNSYGCGADSGVLNYTMDLRTMPAGHASVSSLGVSSTPVTLGQDFTVSFSLKETQGNPKTFQKIAVAILKGDGQHLFDCRMFDNVTISANQTWSNSATCQIYTTNPTGTYKAIMRGKLAGGNWFDFDTTGGGMNPISFQAVTGSTLSVAIKGKVIDWANNPISGATVYLNSLSTSSQALTDANGNFTLYGAVGGSYSLYGEKAGVCPGGAAATTGNLRVTPSLGQSQNHLLIMQCHDTSKKPVIIIPGIFGSTSKTQKDYCDPSDSGVFKGRCYPNMPEEMKQPSSSFKILSPDVWLPPVPVSLDAGGRDALTDALRNAGYIVEHLPWDWRVETDEAAGIYLKDMIDRVKAQRNVPYVNVVAHSQGGLVTRAYIQGLAKKDGQDVPYENDIGQFIMLGTPNGGAANPYYMLEGGDPIEIDNLTGTEGAYFGLGIGMFYSETTNRLYYVHYKKNAIGFGGYNDYKVRRKELVDFYKEHVEGASNLMAKNLLLCPDCGSSGQAKVNTFNSGVLYPWLHNELNDSSSPGFNRLGKLGELSKVQTHLILSDEKQTIDKINVSENTCFHSDGTSCALIESIMDKYLFVNEYGVPYSVARSAGDGTVVASRARAPLDGKVTISVVEAGEHSGLMKSLAQCVVNSLDSGGSCENWMVSGAAAAVSPATKSKVFVAQSDASSSSATMSTASISQGLSINVNGNPQPYLIDPNGLASGVNVESGEMQQDIPGTELTLIEGASLIETSTPATGTYTLKLKGVSPDTHEVNISYTDGNGVSASKTVNGVCDAGEVVSFTFALDPSAQDILQITPPLAGPTNIQASVVGGMTTLSWDAASGAAGYRIYGKRAESALFALLGTTTLTQYDTGTEWNENRAGEHWFYIVVSEGADGSKSFFEESVDNQPIIRTLSVTKTGSGTGTITSSPFGISCGSDCSEQYNAGTTLTLTAAPDAGSGLAGWSGCTVDEIDPLQCHLALDADTTVTVTFSLDNTPPTPGTVTPANTAFGSFVGSTFDLSTTFTDTETVVTGCEYTTDGTTWNPATVSGMMPNFTCTMTGISGTNGQTLTLNMRATSAGGTGTGTPITRTVDAQAPTTTDDASSAWTNISPVTVTLTPSDGTGSGVAETKYCVDTTATCTPSTAGTSVNVTCMTGSDCIQYVRYFSVDNLGNQESVKTSSQIRQDMLLPNPPIVTGTTPTTDTTPTWTWLSGGGGGNGTFRYQLDSEAGAWTETVAFSFTPVSPLSIATHTLYVQERDTAGNWSVSGSKTVLIDTTAPTDGTLTATAGDAQVSLSWSGFSDATSGIGSYRLVYSASGTPGSCSSGTQIYSDTGISYTHNSLTNGTTYYYRVCAIDNAGNISTGATASTTPQAPISNITVNPPSLNFRSVNIGKSSIKAVTVTNTGTANLLIGTIEIAGTDASEFSILNDTCSGQTIASSGTCRVDVRFSPTSGTPARFSIVEYFKQAMSLFTPMGYKQTKSAILNIPSNDPYTPTLDVPLSGKGYATMMQRILDIQKVWQRSLFPSAGK